MASTLNSDNGVVSGSAGLKSSAARTEEFKPYDDAIAKQIPGQADGAEAARAVIRAKYAAMQTAIDAAATVDEIKAALPT